MSKVAEHPYTKIIRAELNPRPLLHERFLCTGFSDYLTWSQTQQPLKCMRISDICSFDGHFFISLVKRAMRLTLRLPSTVFSISVSFPKKKYFIFLYFRYFCIINIFVLNFIFAGHKSVKKPGLWKGGGWLWKGEMAGQKSLLVKVLIKTDCSSVHLIDFPRSLQIRTWRRRWCAKENGSKRRSRRTRWSDLQRSLGVRRSCREHRRCVAHR